MYSRSHFAEPRLERLHDTIRRSGLATLFTAGAGGLDASHLPLLLDPAPAPHGRLLGHLARANPQWRATPPDHVEAMLEGIVGVELTITGLEGKWKVSQNRSEADRRGVADGLEREGAAALAGLVRRPEDG